jgi:PAS domain S-box-containing protein
VLSPDHKPFLLESRLTALLTIGIFILDLLTPAGIAEWLLYTIPLALAWSLQSRLFLYAGGMITLLMFMGHVMSPGASPSSALFNRLLGIGVLWLFVMAWARRRGVRTQGEESREQMAQALTAAQTERTHAESEKAAALEARAYAEAAVLGAVAGQRRAEEEMLGDRLRLEGIVQSAMDAIITVDDEQRIVLFNHAAERMFERNASEMFGRPLDGLIPGRFRGPHGEHIRRFGQSGITARQMGALGMITGLRAEGEEFPIEAAISQVQVEGRRYYTVILRDITERKRLEKDLAEREALLRAIIETEPECVKVLDLNGKVRTMNAAGLAMMEAKSSQEIVGTDAYNLAAEEFRPAFGELIAKAGHGEAGRLEFEAVALQGTRRWLDTHVVPLRGADGTITAVLGVTRDVTERKQAEKLLRLSEERYRRLLSVLPDAILVIREDRIMFINEQGLRLFGAAKGEDILGTSPYGIFHSDSHPLADERLQEFLGAHGTVPETDEKIVRLDGAIVDVEVSAVRFTDEEGAGILMVLRDMTQRKLAEQRLRESEERLQSLLGSMEDVIWSSSLDLAAVHYVSPSVTETYGRPIEDFIRTPSLRLDMAHQEDRPTVVKAVVNLGATEEFDVEYRIVRPDGAIRWLHDRGHVIKDDLDQPLRIDGIASDITERKRLQEQLRRTERVAELGTLASGMAHEIGTPMNVILGRAEYLMERTKEEPVRKGLQTIVSQVERITRVMNQLLAFARRRPIERRALDLRRTIEDNLEIFQERLAHNRITVETACADACPVVHADADQMSQVLINLVVNAIHAMPDGGFLKIALVPRQDMVELTLSDTGQGMSPEVIAKIFDPFYTTKEFGNGTGLGLTVVKGIIEEHNGTIHVESEVGAGTMFTICLPIHQAD